MLVAGKKKMHSGVFPLLYAGITYVDLELFIPWKISKTQQQSSVSPGFFSQLDAFITSVSVSLMGIGLFRYSVVSGVCGKWYFSGYLSILSFTFTGLKLFIIASIILLIMLQCL